MRKFFNLALIGAIALGFQACSSDEQLTDGSEDIVKDGFYLQLSINYTSDADSRADMTDPEDSGVSQIGIENEYTVNSAYLYIFRAQDGVFEAVEGLGTAKSTPNDGLSNPKRIAAALKTNTPYHAYLICNYKYTNRDGSAADPTTEEEFIEHIQSFDSTTSEGYMPMTSRSNDGRLYASFTLTADNYRTSDDPVVLSFSVERAYARLALDVEGINNNCYDIYSSENETTDRKKVGVIYLDRYRILNYLPDGYLFRHVGNLVHTSVTTLNGITSFGPVQSTNIQNGNHYVVDPYTIATTASDFSTYNSDSEYKLISEATTKFDTSLSGTNLAILGYVHENTVHRDLQVKGNLTNIFLRGAIIPDADLVKGLDEDGTLTKDTYTQGQVLYYDLRNMCFYNSFKAVQVAIKNTQVADEITDLRAYNIVKYPEGYIYFQYFIRHRVAEKDDHSDIHEKDQLGVMEYGIVRNNTYNIKIVDVVMPGNPTDDYDPIENVELSEYYLKAKLDVKPWIVKSQSVDLGGN